MQGKSILLTCGLGDFFAIVSAMTQEERYSIWKIFYRTEAESEIQEFVPLFFPNCSSTITVTPVITDDFLVDVEDYSTNTIANHVIAGKRAYAPLHELVQRSLALIDTTDFNFAFSVLHTHSGSLTGDLSKEECEYIARSFQKKKVYGVVIGSERFPVESDWLVDRTNQYNIFEIIELLKIAKKGYIGCASVYSIIASKIHHPSNLIIKVSPLLKDNWWKFYYSPNRESSFIHENLLWL